MPVDPLFSVASNMAEESLEFLTLANMKAAEGKADEAREYLKCVTALAISELADVLCAMRDKLASVAEGKITRHSANGVYHYASAHEATESVWTAASILFWNEVDLPPDLLDWFGVDVSALRAGICRERARLLRDEADVPEAVIPADGAEYDEKDVPAAFRENGKPNGKPLIGPYLKENSEWDLKKSYVSQHYGPDKPLTKRIKVRQEDQRGRLAYAYLYKELSALRRNKTENIE